MLHKNPTTRRTAWLTALLVMCLTGCGGGGSQNDDQQSSRGTFAGRFTDGFETSAFRPCGGDESYWVGGNTQAIYDAIRPNGGTVPPAQITTVYVETTGTVGPRGKFGHLGMYPRQLTIDQVSSVKSTPPDTCR